MGGLFDIIQDINIHLQSCAPPEKQLTLSQKVTA